MRNPLASAEYPGAGHTEPEPNINEMMDRLGEKIQRRPDEPRQSTVPDQTIMVRTSVPFFIALAAAVAAGVLAAEAVTYLMRVGL